MLHYIYSKLPFNKTASIAIMVAALLVLTLVAFFTIYPYLSHTLTPDIIVYR